MLLRVSTEPNVLRHPVLRGRRHDSHSSENFTVNNGESFAAGDAKFERV